jgi:hypothetical protein
MGCRSVSVARTTSEIVSHTAIQMDFRRRNVFDHPRGFAEASPGMETLLGRPPFAAIFALGRHRTHRPIGGVGEEVLVRFLTAMPTAKSSLEVHLRFC